MSWLYMEIRDLEKLFTGRHILAFIYHLRFENKLTQ